MNGEFDVRRLLVTTAVLAGLSLAFTAFAQASAAGLDAKALSLKDLVWIVGSSATVGGGGWWLRSQLAAITSEVKATRTDLAKQVSDLDGKVTLLSERVDGRGGVLDRIEKLEE